MQDKCNDNTMPRFVQIEAPHAQIGAKLSKTPAPDEAPLSDPQPLSKSPPHEADQPALLRLNAARHRRGQVVASSLGLTTAFFAERGGLELNSKRA